MKYTYCEQRIAAERELKLRKSVYPSRVQRHRMSPEKATHEIELMQAIVDTLRALEEHERLL